MNNICFIPARNSSTRFKNKNIAKFGDGDLITNAIDEALYSFVFDRIILSSNDLLILDTAKKFNYKQVETHLRDDSEDQLIGVIRNAITDLKLDDDDNFCLLLVTCPLRNHIDIVRAHTLFLENDRYHTVVSVRKNIDPIQMSFKMDEGGHLEPVMPVEFFNSTRKQDHTDTFYYNDAIIIDTVKNWMDKHRPTLYGRMPIPYLMPPERSVAIDYEFQLHIANAFKEIYDGKI